MIEQEIGQTERSLPPQADTIRAEVAAKLGIPATEIGADDDLVGLGLDSLGVMVLATAWQAAGVDITFGDLIEEPTLTAWERLLGRGGATRQAPEEPVQDGTFALAPMQHAYWSSRRPGMPMRTGSHFYFEFDTGPLDVGRLDRAVSALRARHPMLRTCVSEEGSQRVRPDLWGLDEVVDLRGLDADARATRLEKIRAQMSHQTLRIEDGQGVDARLALVDEESCRLFLDIDMIVCDAGSFGIVVGDLARLYAADGIDERPPALRYPDYLRLVEQSDRIRDRDVAYWRDRAESLPTAPALPLSTAPEQLDEVVTVRRHAWLPPEAYARLAELAREHRVTTSMTLATVYADVLAAWSDSPNFLLNLPVLNRLPVHPEVNELVGDFTDLLLLEVRPDPTRPFIDRVRAVQEQYRRDAAHSTYGGTSVLRDLARTAAGLGHRSGVVFTSAMSLGELFDAPARELLGQPVWMSSQTPGVWLDLQLVERDGGLLINWEAAENLFSPGVPAAMLEAFVDRVRQLATVAGAWSQPLPVSLPVGQAVVRERVNATEAPIEPRLLHQPVFAHAARVPDRVAVRVGDTGRVLTYGELAGEAMAIAGCLRVRGMREGDPVAVSVPKGPDQITAVLGVLAAGGCYVPIGVDQPPARRNRILATAGAGHALVTGDYEAGEWPAEVQVIDLFNAAAHPPLKVPAEPSPDELAYVIFTSGSTGEPKGVEITHAAAANTIDALNDRYGIGSEDRVLAVSALDFDLSVYDIFGLLAAGGQVVSITEDIRREAAAWARLVRQHDITVWNTVPTLLEMLLIAAEDRHRLPSLKVAMVSGDWVGLDLMDRLRAVAPTARLVAMGGATEAAIWSNVFDVDRIDPAWVSIPYGHPLPNQRYRVVDPYGRDRPDWVPGELWIGGTGVARGYRGDPQRTAASFPTTDDGRRWYRTGDQGRYHPDGSLEFLGRTDHQVKVRGHRIELGEIETRMRELPGVSHAVAWVDAAGTGKRLVAAVAGTGLEADGVRAQLAAAVPGYMVPEHIQLLDAMPLTPNGKIDRAKVQTDLAEQLAAHTEAGATAATELTGVEATLAAVWAELFGSPSLTSESNFFHLGGDSLLATRMLADLRRKGLSGSLGDLFSSPTVAGFAGRLAPLDGSGDETGVIEVDLERRHDPFALTDVQRAYWLGRHPDFALGGVGSYWYWEFEADSVDLMRLEDAWNRVIERHEMMRAVLDDNGSQRILPTVPRFRLAVRTTTRADHDEAVAELRRMDSQILDVTSWPLFDVRAVQCDDGRTVIGVGFDYIVLDALSIVTVLSEVSARYTDPGTELPELELSFRDYLRATKVDDAVRRRDEDYWLRTIDELPPPPVLPLQVEPEQVGKPRFARREFRIEPDQWQQLRRRTAEHGLTISTVVATAFAEVLAAWSADPALTLTLTVFDRQNLHPEVNEVVGDFTSLMLLGHTSTPDEPWAQTVRRVQGQVWEGMEHNGVSATWVLQQLAQRQGAAQMLMPVVFTSTLGVAGAFPDLELSFGTQTRGLSQTPQVTLDCQVIEQGGGLNVNWDYVEGLFSPGVIEAASDAMRSLLESLADHDWNEAPLPVLVPVDQAAVRERVNATDVPIEPRLLHQPVFAHAVRVPDRVAVRAGGTGRVLTYGELAGQALAIAGCLRARGVREGDPVAVSVPKGPDQITAVLGVLAAGGCYVPIGVDQPAARRNRILATAGAGHVLVTGDHDPGQWPAEVELIDLLDAAAHPPLKVPAQPSPDELAYVIFTSGSTGEPKGVEITHAAAANTIDALNDRYVIGAKDRVLAVSALDFDLSVYDIFGLLAVGGQVVTITEDIRREAAAWARLVRQHDITVWNTVPTLLDMLLIAAEGRHRLPSLKVAMVSGDWVGLDLMDRLNAIAPHARLVAMGGATEAAIWSNVFDVDRIDPAWVSIPYGHPLPNQRYRVVDPYGRDRPDWVPGELWIGGAGVARGYRGDPQRTAASFPTTDDGRRWYRTGDQGRYHPDGSLEFLGRTDHQVKVRGHRIELGEIETRMRELPGVSHAVAWVDAAGTGKRLVAAVAGTGLEADGVRAQLAAAVPGYMVPEHIQLLDAMPLTPNGKIDRAALARASTAAVEPARIRHAPQGTTECAVAEIWQDVLEVTEISRDAGFFELGGDSLTAMHVAQRLARRFAVELTLRQLFDHPTLTQVAALIDELTRVTDDLDAPVRLEEGVL
ncbi:amino acid adenylation domain-containing protein [Streptomyces sp. HC44]|uniref:Phenyloxazoline synthase MbtB n=1 Tax=Streptomyces scabichelini TaxID=2711217 RepID=A0A6G4V1E6_9ACTN|nr:non-ribosomal peptide synthetase [Streptomyces scabichelini]NGO07872.1 amino acid adenylation domain-containing protein [Streptomyces scabichelini]